MSQFMSNRDGHVVWVLEASIHNDVTELVLVDPAEQ